MGGHSKKLIGGKNSDEESSMAEEPSHEVLPVANIVHLMKLVLPHEAKIAESAEQLIHDCVDEFVGHVGGEAADRTRSEHRRTLIPEDFSGSFENTGFENYVDPMYTYIKGYREYYDERAPAAVDTLSPGAPVTVTDDELELLQSVTSPPPAGGN